MLPVLPVPNGGNTRPLGVVRRSVSTALGCQVATDAANSPRPRSGWTPVAGARCTAGAEYTQIDTAGKEQPNSCENRMVVVVAS